MTPQPQAQQQKHQKPTESEHEDFTHHVASDEFISSLDLDGRGDVTLEISCYRGKHPVTLPGAFTPEEKPCVWFKGTEKGLVLGAKANRRALFEKLGKDTSKWIGRKITLYKSTCKVAGETKGCVRIK